MALFGQGLCLGFSTPTETPSFLIALQAHEAAQLEAEKALAGLEAAAKAFGRSGIPSFVLEGVLAELQAETGRFLEGMSSGFSLTLSPVKERGGGSKGGVTTSSAAEQITKASRPKHTNT